MKFYYLSLILLVLSGQAQEQRKISILFVGNSLTYVNDLPKLVRELAASDGVQIQTSMIAKPNYALEDHWNDGQLQLLLSEKKFDFVVIQQGPSSQQDGRKMLMDYGSKINALCEQSGSKLAYFMVWPARQNYHMFDGVITNYTDAAEASSALLCPVGARWKDHFETTRDFSFYGSDDFHPSQAGSQKAAEIIYEVLIGN